MASITISYTQNCFTNTMYNHLLALPPDTVYFFNQQDNPFYTLFWISKDAIA
jgi:hypothetical protein